MKIQPLNDRVLVKRLKEDETTAGGIIIPDTAKEKPQRGRVVSIGPGKCDTKGNRIPLQVKKGDHILFSKYAGSELKLDNVEHIIMHESDILGILSDK